MYILKWQKRWVNNMWLTCNYEVKGRKHELMDIPCQDKTAVFRDEANKVTAVALADGAGSAKIAEKGAECVVNKVLPYVNKYFDRIYNNRQDPLIIDELVNYLHEELVRVAHTCNGRIDDLATTMLFCVIKDSRFLAGHIGDGIIGIHCSNSTALLSSPVNGEYVNETFFVSDENAALHMSIYGGEIGDIDGFILLSDGSANSLYEYKSARFSEAVENIFVMSGIMSNESFAKMLGEAFDDIVRKRTTDDCSIALLTLPINDLSKLPWEKQLEIFGVTDNGRVAKKRIKKYVQVANMARSGICCGQIGRNLHIREKYVRKYIYYFKYNGLI